MRGKSENPGIHIYYLNEKLVKTWIYILLAGDDGPVRVRWSCGQGGGSGVEYIVLKKVTLPETLC